VMCRQRSQFSPSCPSIITPSFTGYLRPRHVHATPGALYQRCYTLRGRVISRPARAVLQRDVVSVQPSRTDEDLAAALAARDPRALEELYDRYGRMAFSLAVRIVGSAETAEEVVQEAFLSIWNGAGTYHAGRGTLRPVAAPPAPRPCRWRNRRGLSGSRTCGQM
jgi:hypothetical protein